MRARRIKFKRDWKRYHSIRRKAQAVCHQAYDSLDSFICEDTQKNPKKLYTMVKSERADASCVAPRRWNSITYSDTKTKANLLNHQFVLVFTKEPENTPAPSISGILYPAVNPIQVTSNGIMKLLRSLQSHMTTGPDCIPTHLLNITAEESGNILQLIFQASITQGVIPSDWKNLTLSRHSRKETKQTQPITDQSP